MSDDAEHTENTDIAETEGTQEREPSAVERLESWLQDITDWLHRMFPVTDATPPDVRPPGTPRSEAPADQAPQARPPGPAQGIVSQVATDQANLSPGIAQPSGNETASSATDASGNPVNPAPGITAPANPVTTGTGG